MTMGYLKDMGDWSLAKDYNGAEYFVDGARPLLAETKFADIVIGGYNANDKDERVLVGVYLSYDNCGSFYEGVAENKAKGIEIGEKIAEHISTDFNKDNFLIYFKSFNLSSLSISEDETIPNKSHEKTSILEQINKPINSSAEPKNNNTQRKKHELDI